MNVNAHKSELRPLPMRITRLQYERLVEARGRDGLSVQEHVRRALDFYLTRLERDAEKDAERKAALADFETIEVPGPSPTAAPDLETPFQPPISNAPIHPRSGRPRPAAARVRSR